MQVVINEPFVRSRMKIGNIAHLVSLGLLAVGFALSLPFATSAIGQESIFLAYFALIASLVLLSFGRNYTRRWGPRFRQDHLLASALRRMDDRYTLFNYAAPELPDHVLVGPTGLYVLLPKSHGGRIRFDGRRFSREGIGGTLLRNLFEGGLGNPIGEVNRAIGTLAAYLHKHAPPELLEGLRGRPVIVFTNAGVQLEVRSIPEGLSIVRLPEIRSMFRRARTGLDPEKMEELKRVLGREVEG